MPAPLSPEELAQTTATALELIHEKNAAQLSAVLESLHPVDLVQLLLGIDSESQRQLLKHLTGLDVVAGVVAYSTGELRELILELLDDSRIAAVLRRLEVDDAAAVLAQLSRRRQVRILKRLSAPIVKELTSLLAYEHETAGRIMTTRFLALSPQLSVRDAIQDLRAKLSENTLDAETDLAYAYILSAQGILLGVVSLRELLSSPDEAQLAEIMRKEVIRVNPEDDQEDAAWLIADYDLSAIPVVTPEDEKLLGIITVDDILDVIQEEHAEDILKLAGTEDQDTVSANFRVALRSRFPWLLASWGGGTLGALLLGKFSPVLEQVVALAFFMPVVFGMGGNVGSQSSTITVRGLATGELGQLQVWRRMRREAAIGLTLGTIFAVLLALAAYLLFAEPTLAAVVGISIMITMSFAAALGSILPVIFERFGFDPAVAAGPFVTTSTDILSIVIYFTVATLLL